MRDSVVLGVGHDLERALIVKTQGSAKVSVALFFFRNKVSIVPTDLFETFVEK